jgi:hypothetical protein
MFTAAVAIAFAQIAVEQAAVMEQMLENFHQMFVDLHRRVYQLQASMKSKREIMNIQVNARGADTTKDAKTSLGVADAHRQSVPKDWRESLQ